MGHSMISTLIQFSLPAWVAELVAGWRTPLDSAEDRMRLAIGLAEENMKRQTGGPFGAAVFERDSGVLVAVGVNLVVASQCSIAHAEMLALALAQGKRRTFDLAAPGIPAHELVTSAEPCAMCFGALPWSGVARLVCGARSEDVESIGFEEGPKPVGWIEQLEARGISVLTDVCRNESQHLVRRYGEAGGPIYNPGGRRRGEHLG